MRTERGFGAPVGGAAEASGPTLDTNAVKQKSDAFLAKAKEFCAAYSAALPSQKRAILRGQTVGKELDDFVVAVANSDVSLPKGVRHLDVIGPAVAEFIKLGIPYSVEIPSMFGGSEHSAKALDKDGKPDWVSFTAR